MTLVIGGPPAVSSVAGKTGAVSLVKADVGLGSVDNTSDANKPISTTQQAALDGKAPWVGRSYKSGNYYYVASLAATQTAAVAAGSLRLCPMVVSRPLTLATLGAEVATVGDSGSKVRLGIYDSTSDGMPNNLVIDAGQIAGDSATVQELAASVTLQPGLYWFGAVAQSVTTTAPTLRYCGSSWFPPVPVPIGTTIPTANATQQGLAIASVTGALPSTAGTPTSAGGVPRLFFKVA